jgi:exosortase
MEKPSNIGVLEEFRIELEHCWRRLPNKTFFFVLLAAWLALFHFLGNSTLGFIKSNSLLKWMLLVSIPNNSNEGDGHALAVPFVVLGLFWWKRKELLTSPFQTWLPGLLILALGLIFHLLGFFVQQPRISIVGLFTGTYGLMGLAWGPTFLRRSFFPFCLFAFCIPLGTLAQPLTFRLRVWVCQIVELFASNILAIDIQRAGTILQDPTGKYHYDVAAACSGIRSLSVTLGFGLIYGFLAFRNPWKRIVMIGAGLPLAILGNVLRLLSIVIAAEIGGQEAGSYVHDGGPMGIFSLLPYVPAFVGLFLMGRWLENQDIEPNLPLEPKPV